MISIEILKRYYYQKGSIIQQLKDDPDLKEALKVLGDTEKYHSLLSPKATADLAVAEK